MDRTTIHGVRKSQIKLSDYTFTFKADACREGGAGGAQRSARALSPWDSQGIFVREGEMRRNAFPLASPSPFAGWSPVEGPLGLLEQSALPVWSHSSEMPGPATWVQPPWACPHTGRAQL